MSIGNTSSLPDLKTIRQQLSSDDEKERWRGAADLGEYVFDHPEEAWPLVLEFGSSAVEDTRSAIATCVLEHILEHHFDVYFPVLVLEIETKLCQERPNTVLRLATPAKVPQKVPQNAKVFRGLLTA